MPYTLYMEQIRIFGVKRTRKFTMRKLAILLSALLVVASAQSQTPVKWYSIEEAYALTKKEPRKILIDVYTDWCSWCKVMDRNTFNNQIIAEYINKTFYPVKFNAETKTNVVLDGKTYKYVPNGTRGYNELAYELLKGQLGYPSVVFLDEKTNLLQPVQGYIKPYEFDLIIKFIGSDAFKTTKWEDFKAKYVSTIPQTEEQ
jgi:thioredoxin-related protein